MTQDIFFGICAVAMICIVVVLILVVLLLKELNGILVKNEFFNRQIKIETEIRALNETLRFFGSFLRRFFDKDDITVQNLTIKIEDRDTKTKL